MCSITERGGVIGVVKGNGETETFLPKANFSLIIVAKVEGSKDGYIARITRAPDNVTRDCFFSASSSMHKNEFIHAINASFGSGGMFCTLTDIELGSYLLKKVMSFMRQDQPRTLRAVRHIGQQECCPPIFVLSPELHMNEDGEVIDCDHHRIYFDKQYIEPRLLPVIPTPFTPSLKALQDLWLALKCCAQHNKDPALFTLGAVAMNIHFQTLVELKGGAPVVVLYGEPDVGKTTIANAAMSVAGIEACSFRGMRREYFVHLASLTSLGLLYDDPNKLQEVENIIIDFYNGMTRGSFKRGLETPQCGFMLSCNFSLGKIQRLLSRVVIIPFKSPSIRARNDEQRTAFSSLKDYKEKACSVVGHYIALGRKYRATGIFKVDEYEEKLSALLPNCRGRTIKGYANLVWFTEQVAELVGEPTTVVWNAIKKLAPQLDKLQHKEDTITSEEVADPDLLREKFWEKVGTSLIDLAKSLDNQHQARSFLQVGKHSGQESISVAVDVATNLMQKKGITAKFTLEELRDNITQYKCGCRGQSRKFNELDKTGWNGKTKSLKVPVIHLSAFSPDIRTALIKCVYPNYEPNVLQPPVDVPINSDPTDEPVLSSSDPTEEPVIPSDIPTDEPILLAHDSTDEPVLPMHNSIEEPVIPSHSSTSHDPTDEPVTSSNVPTEEPIMPITEPTMLSHEVEPEPMDDSANPTRRRAKRRCGDAALFDSLHEGVIAHTRRKKN